MENIDSYVDFVKDQIAFQQRMADKYSLQPYRQGMHLTSAKKFQDLFEILQTVKNGVGATGDRPVKGVNSRRRIMLSLDDIKDVPNELLEELNLTETDKQEMMIESIISEAGGILSLDRILVELYKRTGQVHKRNTVISRLYRMGNRGLIYSLPSKKGLYSTYEMSEQDVKRLFGQLDSESDIASGGATGGVA
jgi:hypothetical protein